MGEIVKELGVQRQQGWMYFINKEGDVCGFQRGQKAKLVARAGITKDPHYLYYLDKEGNVGRAKLKNKR